MPMISFCGSGLAAGPFFIFDSGILGCDVYNAVFKMLPADAIPFLLKTRQPEQI
jgi:hypothetical protein